MAQVAMVKPRIAIVDHVGIKAGMDCYDLGLCEALNRAGYISSVYSNFSDPADSTKMVFRFRVHENLFSVIRLMNAYFRLASKMKNAGSEYCILHGFRFGFWEWFFMRTIAKTRAKIFLVVHDPESLIGKKTRNNWKAGMFLMAHKIIVHNKYCNEVLKKDLSAELAGKVAIIPHGNYKAIFESSEKVEQFRFENNLQQGKKCILFFGQIKETKGLDILLEAFAKTERKCYLLIAGRMRRHSFEKYEFLISKYDLKDHVKLIIGYITPEKRNILFQLADAVVMPYRKVYQSGVMLMAMSYGKAVIASDLPPNKEIISDKQNGFLFRSENETELAAVLRDVIKNDIAREEVAGRGKAFVQEQLNWNTIAREWIKHFES
ncbi:MAG: glycosyltransferase family 4 protein [Bacteroidetes bacterium]|nr:glycosyltransferase family 4 protein [Bacteroidota bacterium]